MGLLQVFRNPYPQSFSKSWNLGTPVGKIKGQNTLLGGLVAQYGRQSGPPQIFSN
jgi:hypothetical protein